VAIPGTERQILDIDLFIRPKYWLRGSTNSEEKSFADCTPNSKDHESAIRQDCGKWTAFRTS
jgi:hypothetical protein